MSETIDKHFDAISTITYVAKNLYSLSNCFYRTGNDHLGSELGSMATHLMDAEKQLTEAYSRLSKERLNDAQSTAGKLLGVALSMGSDR